MTTLSVCKNCGVKVAGAVRQCAECGSHRVELQDPPTRPKGCQCGRCEEGPNMSVIRCAGAGVVNYELEAGCEIKTA